MDVKVSGHPRYNKHVKYVFFGWPHFAVDGVGVALVCLDAARWS